MTLALSVRKLRHESLEVLQRDDTRRFVQLLFNPGERGRWCRATAATLILICILILGLGFTFRLVLGFACL